MTQPRVRLKPGALDLAIRASGARSRYHLAQLAGLDASTLTHMAHGRHDAVGGPTIAGLINASGLTFEALFDTQED